MLNLASLRECRLSVAILVAGMPGSGKSLVSKAAESLGVKVVRMGDIVRLLASSTAQELSDRVLGELSRKIREVHGPDVVARATLHIACNESPGGVVLIEGVRSLDEVRYFKDHAERCVVVAVHSPPQVRFQRLLARGRSDDPSSWEDFAARDERELSFGLGSVIALADYVIVNHEKTPEEVLQESKNLLRRILGECQQGAR